MSGRIYQKKIKGKSYYYYQESYRKKVDPQTCGKYKGSGISRVRTNTIYLGDAQTVLSWKMKAQGPLSVEHRAFGLLGAAYQTAIESGLLEALKTYIVGERYGMPRWVFFLVTILNRLEYATSKNQMPRWVAKTILPKLLGVDPGKFTSKNFWYVSDDIISEKELKKKRQQQEGDTLFCGLDEAVFNKIEEDVFQGLKPLLSEPARSVVYDTTNFFTFFQSHDASELARTGHNKDSHHHLRQVGLAMAVDRELGIPFYHRVYRGNSQDAATFNTIVADLLCSINASFDKVEELVLVLDKGNNKKETFGFLSGKIEWVGSLVPSQHKDLLQVPVEQYALSCGGIKTLRRQKIVMGREYLLVMTYNPKLFRKQVHTLSRGIEKLKSRSIHKLNCYLPDPLQELA